MQVETLEARNFSNDDALAIGKLLATVWPSPEKSAEYRAQQLLNIDASDAETEAQLPTSFVVREGEQVIAHSGILPRRIRTSAGEMVIAGLAQVCCDPNQRGRGLGETIARAALTKVDDGSFPFALFQTSPEVRPFYEKLGASVVENRIINSLAEDPETCPFWDAVAMRYPNHGDWPEGEIDLRGPGY